MAERSFTEKKRHKNAKISHKGLGSDHIARIEISVIVHPSYHD